MKQKLLQAMAVVLLGVSANAQVNSGSNGSDGALDFSAAAPNQTITISMADHPNGIYQYTYVNIPTTINLKFTPNANNTPLVWLVQSNVYIGSRVDISGLDGSGAQCYGISGGGRGGPGGWSGGNGGVSLTAGQGPGGGQVSGNAYWGANASYGTLGMVNDANVAPGLIYGSSYLIPLLGGSGGGGATSYSGVGGGGGGGAFLIAASGSIAIGGYGQIIADGGNSGCGSANCGSPAGAGSGGAVRLVASKISGSGYSSAGGGSGSGNSCNGGRGGAGRIRFDTYENDFSGNISGVFTQGSQFIIIPSSGQLPQLTVTSVGGVSVSASPTGALSTPDAVLSAQQNNPIPVVVSCANLPLNTPITVSVKPANGATVTATGYNTTGTLAASTAIISIVMPRGGGLIYATAATGN